MDYKDKLKSLQPSREFFIGIDSDGCVFDTMEIKQKECFCPNFIKYFKLQNISKYARETWEFVNLYSKTRGLNRFLAIIEAFDQLSKRPEVIDRDIQLPDTKPIIEWTQIETKLGNPALADYVEKNNIPILKDLLDWSTAVNNAIKDMVFGIGPFPFFRESLEKMNTMADIIVVSQTPVEALVREWEENKVADSIKIIAGQEYGTKAEHLEYAAKGKYPDDKILMIGDAPGDRKSAEKNGVLFYPINPGHEEDSWERFYKEGLEKFVKGEFSGSYQRMLIDEYEALLPEKPRWKQI